MRILFFLLSLFSFGPLAQGEIIAVALKDPAVAKKYKKHLVSYAGELVLLGEPKSGFSYDPATRILSWAPDGPNELFVVDPKKPGNPAYSFSKGEKVPGGKQHVLTL